MTKDGLNADDAARVLRVSHPAMFSLRFATHDEPVGANQPMQLIQVRVNTWLAGSGRSLLSSIPDRIVEDITGYLESLQHPAIKEANNRVRRAGAPPGA
jgi:hypothetical protein